MAEISSLAKNLSGGCGEASVPVPPPTPGCLPLSYTYQVQGELLNFCQRRGEQQRRTLLAEAPKDLLLDEKDPLWQYNLCGSDPITAEQRRQETQADPNRYYKEVRHLLNVNSRAREPICASDNPFEKPTRKTEEEEEACTAVSVPLSHYQWPLETPLNNVKSVRPLSMEIPSLLLPGVSAENNVIEVELVHEREKGTVQSVLFVPEYTLPYLVVRLPPGQYSPQELLAALEELLNLTIHRYTIEHYQDLFRLMYDPETGAISIRLDEEHPHLRFYFRFSPHPQVEQLSLYYLLGFEFPNSRSGRSGERYVREWTNLSLPEHPCHRLCWTESYRQRRPYRPVDLNPHKYIYLAIRGLATITDPLVRGYDLFAKILLPLTPQQPFIPLTNFIHGTKFFTEVPLRQLQALRISWVDAYGQLVDWQHQEHSFTLEVVQYVDLLCDVGFSSLRGAHDKASFTLSSKHL